MSKHSEMRRSEFALRNKQFLTNLHLHCQATLLHRVKSVEMWSFSGLYFPAFGLNTEWYSNSPHSVWMRENTDLKKLRIWTAFTQYYPIWAVYEFLLINWNALLICKVFHFDKSKTKTSMDCPYTGSVCVCVCVHVDVFSSFAKIILHVFSAWANTTRDQVSDITLRKLCCLFESLFLYQKIHKNSLKLVTLSKWFK